MASRGIPWHPVAFCDIPLLRRLRSLAAGLAGAKHAQQLKQYRMQLMINSINKLEQSIVQGEPAHKRPRREYY